MHKLQSRIRTRLYTGLNKFFRARLLISNADQLADIVKDLDKQAADIRDQSIKLAWHMRGGMTYEHILQLSSSERRMISDLIKENYETTKKSGLPHF